MALVYQCKEVDLYDCYAIDDADDITGIYSAEQEEDDNGKIRPFPCLPVRRIASEDYDDDGDDGDNFNNVKENVSITKGEWYDYPSAIIADDDDA